MKKVTIGATRTTTTYLRDASGNVMAIYEEKTNQTLAIKEIPIYGSSRLGQYRPKADTKKTALGQRIYEFSNHLGNVLVTLTDNKVPQTDGTYESVVVSASDYYPFGMAMAERTYSNSEYRYGFNGKENDTEFAGGVQDFDARFYSGVIGRMLSIDPLTVDFADHSPFSFAANNPIFYIDEYGLKPRPAFLQFIWDLLGLDNIGGMFSGKSQTDEEFVESVEKTNDRRHRTKKVKEVVNDMSHTYENTIGVVVPGYSALMQYSRGEHGNASFSLGTDLVGGKVIGTLGKYAILKPLSLLIKKIPNTDAFVTQTGDEVIELYRYVTKGELDDIVAKGGNFDTFKKEINGIWYDMEFPKQFTMDLETVKKSIVEGYELSTRSSRHTPDFLVKVTVTKEEFLKLGKLLDFRDLDPQTYGVSIYKEFVDQFNAIVQKLEVQEVDFKAIKKYLKHLEKQKSKPSK